MRCDCGFREIMKVITVEMLVRPDERVPNEEILENLAALCIKVNGVLAELKVNDAVVTSGYRTPEHNAAIGGAPNSRHCLGMAVDLLDKNRALGSKLYANLDVLKRRGMSMEDLAYTVKASGAKWVHLQNGLPGSGKTVFIPYAGPPKL